jgi:acetyl-CoA synthetase
MRQVKDPKSRRSYCMRSIGSPDEVRTEIVKAFVVPLAAHEYPREVEFVSELPMTATGKIMRKELKKLCYEVNRWIPYVNR